MTVKAVAPVSFSAAEEQAALSSSTGAKPVFQSVLEMNGSGRPVSLYIQRTTVDLKVPAQRQAVIENLFRRLEGVVSRTQIEASLAPGGALAKVVNAGSGSVNVRDIEADANAVAAPPPAPKQVTVPANRCPTPGIRPTYVVAEVQLADDQLSSPPDLRTREYEAYRAARARLVGKIETAMTEEACPATARSVSDLKAALQRLDIAANPLRKGAIPPPRDMGKLDSQANVIYQAAYSVALAEENCTPVPEWEINHYMPRFVEWTPERVAQAVATARASHAEDRANAVFGVLTGDPLETAIFSTQPDIAAALE